jgi:hypothetical protein
LSSSFFRRRVLPFCLCLLWSVEVGWVSQAVIERICKHCNQIFFPDWRNRHRQRFCQQPNCRTASHTASQAKWLAQNPDYFRGSEHVQRVQKWRREHPGYARRQPPPPLQEIIQSKPVEPQAVADKPPPPRAEPLQDRSPPLQDFIISKYLIVGLLAHQFDCTLQEDIHGAMRRLVSKGRDILGTTPGTQWLNLNLPTKHDPKETPSSRTAAPRAGAVQLAGSPPGEG